MPELRPVEVIDNGHPSKDVNIHKNNWEKEKERRKINNQDIPSENNIFDSLKLNR